MVRKVDKCEQKFIFNEAKRDPVSTRLFGIVLQFVERVYQSLRDLGIKSVTTMLRPKDVFEFYRPTKIQINSDYITATLFSFSGI